VLPGWCGGRTTRVVWREDYPGGYTPPAPWETARQPGESPYTPLGTPEHAAHRWYTAAPRLAER